MGEEGVSGSMQRTKGTLMDSRARSGSRSRKLKTDGSAPEYGANTNQALYFCNFARARNPTVCAAASAVAVVAWGNGATNRQRTVRIPTGCVGFAQSLRSGQPGRAHRPASVLVALDVDALLRRGFGGEGGKQRSLPAEHTGLWPINITKSRVRTPYTVHVTRVYTWNAPPLGDSARLAPARARLSSASTVSVVAAHRPAQGSQPSML